MGRNPSASRNASVTGIVGKRGYRTARGGEQNPSGGALIPCNFRRVECGIATAHSQWLSGGRPNKQATSSSPMPSSQHPADIDQIILEAQHRWLRAPEIFQILRNYEKIGLTPEPPNRPPSGSLLIFDRNMVRYFRKDGYNWKKKDGKTVKEANEKLKVGSVDALQCYYAHGEEDDQNFQRRIYWMLKGVLAHVVLVHYRDVQANRTNFNCYRESEVIPDSQKPRENIIHNFEVDSFVYSEIQPNRTLQVMDSASLDDAHASEFENAESDNYQGQFSANPAASFESITQREKNKISMDNGQSSENVMDTSTDGFQAINVQPPFSSAQSSVGMMLGQENELVGQVISGAIGKRKAFERHSNGPRKTTCALELHNTIGLNVDDNAKNPALGQTCFDGLDNLDDWMSNELGDITESQMQPGSRSSWETVGVEGGGDDYCISARVLFDNCMLVPSLSQDKLYSINDEDEDFTDHDEVVDYTLRTASIIPPTMRVPEDPLSIPPTMSVPEDPFGRTASIIMNAREERFHGPKPEKVNPRHKSGRRKKFCGLTCF